MQAGHLYTSAVTMVMWRQCLHYFTTDLLHASHLSSVKVWPETDYIKCFGVSEFQRFQPNFNFRAVSELLNFYKD